MTKPSIYHIIDGESGEFFHKFDPKNEETLEVVS